MARVKIEEIVDHLDYDLKKALGKTIGKLYPEVKVDERALFREFRRAVGRRCNTWETVPDRYVDCG